LGTPTEEDLRKLSLIVEERVLSIIKNAMTLPKMDLRLFFNKGKYSATDIEQAADLVHSMLRWVPSERVSAADAMRHPFLQSTVIN
jgi:serine/threonine protein kinase